MPIRSTVIDEDGVVYHLCACGSKLLREDEFFRFRVKYHSVKACGRVLELPWYA